MDPGLRTTTALMSKINDAQGELIKHYEELIKLAGTRNPSRNTTAIIQYRMQVETAALVRAGQELQLLIRQMQEMWLFGQLNTLGESEVQQQTDDKAKAVGDLLRQVLELQQSATETGTGGGRGEEVANGIS